MTTPHKRSIWCSNWTIALAALSLLGLFLSACAPSPQTRQSADGYALAPALDGQRRQLILANFGKVAYYASDQYSGGTGSGRPLILTHSINAAASAYEMKPLWQAYKGQRPVYALEWPGFGSSQRPDVRYSRVLMTKAILALINQLKLQYGPNFQADVVSLSLGSEFVTRAALQEPNIHSLSLISPSGMGKPRNQSQQAAADRSSESRYQTLRFFSWPLYDIIRSRPSIEYFLGLSFRNPVPKDLIDYASLTSAQEGAKYAPLFFLSGHLFTNNAYNDLYNKLDTPTLVLYDKDAFVSFDRLPALTQKANIQAKRIPETDGLPHFEKFPAVQAELEKFWDNIDTSSIVPDSSD